MPVEGREKGLRSPLEVRFGITTPTYLGVNTQKPALALLDGEGVEGINLRIKGGRPISRGGQAKVNVDTIAPIHGFTDTTSDAGINPNRELNEDIGTPYNALYAIGNDAEGAFVHIDKASLVVVTTGLHDAGRPSSVPIDWNGGVVAGIAFGETETEVTAVPSLLTLFPITHAGTSAKCTSLLAMGTDLLAVWDDSGIGIFVGLWDGAHLTTDLAVPNTLSGVLMKFQGTAWLGHSPPGGSPLNTIYRRRPGAGSWATLSLPSATAFRTHHGISYRGRLYVIGEDTDEFVIYSTDGLTFVKERTISVVATAPAVAQLAVIRGNLYYWYHDGTDGADFSMIGKFDGASWDDDNKNLGAQIDSQGYARGLGFVGGHDGADAIYADESGNIHVWESDGINIFGTWTKVLSHASGVVGSSSPTPPIRVSTVKA